MPKVSTLASYPCVITRSPYQTLLVLRRVPLIGQRSKRSVLQKKQSPSGVQRQVIAFCVATDAPVTCICLHATASSSFVSHASAIETVIRYRALRKAGIWLTCKTAVKNISLQIAHHLSDWYCWDTVFLHQAKQSRNWWTFQLSRQVFLSKEMSLIALHDRYF